MQQIVIAIGNLVKTRTNVTAYVSCQSQPINILPKIRRPEGVPLVSTAMICTTYLSQMNSVYTDLLYS